MILGKIRGVRFFENVTGGVEMEIGGVCFWGFNGDFLKNDTKTLPFCYRFGLF
jgi:hypothetical protein